MSECRYHFWADVARLLFVSLWVTAIVRLCWDAWPYMVVGWHFAIFGLIDGLATSAALAAIDVVTAINLAAVNVILFCDPWWTAALTSAAAVMWAGRGES